MTKKMHDVKLGPQLTQNGGSRLKPQTTGVNIQQFHNKICCLSYILFLLILVITPAFSAAIVRRSGPNDVTCMPCPAGCACNADTDNVGLCSVICTNQLGLHVDISSFPEPSTVSELGFNGIGLQSPEKEFFDNFINLRILDLGSNSIASLEENIFESLMLLTNLSLASNELSNLPPNFLSHQSNLRKLNLNNNQFNRFEENLFDSLPALNTLAIGENPYVCDCRLEWLKEWLISAQNSGNIDILEGATIKCPHPMYPAIPGFATEMTVTVFQECGPSLINQKASQLTYSSALLRRSKRSRSCYDQLSGSPGRVNGPCDAEDFGTCLYDNEAATWIAFQAQVHTDSIENEADCVVYCANEGYDAGFFESECFCASADSSCGDCGDGLSPGDEICDMEYIPGFWTPSLFGIAGLAPFSTNEIAAITISHDDASINYTINFGDGTDLLATGSGSSVSVLHQYFISGWHTLSITSSAFPSSPREFSVNVIDPPKVTESSTLSGTSPVVMLRSGTAVQVKWTLLNADGSQEITTETCSEDNAEYFEGSESCYKDHGQRSFEEATSRCSNDGGILATPKTQAERDFIQSFLENESREDEAQWLGLSDTQYEGTWIWVDGTQMTSSESTEWAESSSERNCATFLDGTISAEDCDEEFRYVCQTPAWEVYTVPKYFAGVPVSIHGSLATMHNPLTSYLNVPASSTHVYIFPGMFFPTDGMLDAWLFEASGVTNDVEISLQVYRPSCDTGYLVYEGCNNAPFAYCSASDDSCSQEEHCTSGNTYCPLTDTCLSADVPCTCSNTVSSCDTIVYPWEYSTYSLPTYSLVTSQYVILSAGQSGAQKVELSGDFEIRAHDVIGVQIGDGSQLPIRCEDLQTDMTSQWRKSSYVQIVQSVWIIPNQELIYLDSDLTDVHYTKCHIASLYSQPVEIPLPDDFESNFGYTVDIVNTFDSVQLSTESTDTLQMLQPCEIPGDDEEYCAIPTRENEFLLFRIESDLIYDTITLDYGGTNFTSNYSLTCPERFENSTACLEDPGNTYQYWIVNGTFPDVENVTIEAEACTGSSECVTQSINAVLQRRVSIREIDTEPLHIYSNQEVVFTASYSGDPVEYLWNISSDTYYNLSTSDSVPYTFPEPNTYTVRLKMKNLVNTAFREETIHALDVFNGTNLTTQYPEVVALGQPNRIEAVAWFAGYTRGLFTFSFGDNGASRTDEQTHYARESAYITAHTRHSFELLGLQLVNVTLTDPVDDAFFDFASNFIEVWHPINQVTLTSDNNIIETGSDVTFTVNQINGTGNLTYRVVFQDNSTDYNSGVVFTDSITVTHRFTAPGSYNVSAEVDNIVTDKSAFYVLSVQDRIEGMQVTYDGPNRINETTTITVTLTSGTDVIYEVDDGNRGVTNQSDPIFVLDYDSIGTYTVSVTARNGINSMSESIEVEIVDLGNFTLFEIFHDECVPLENAQFTANLTYHSLQWLQFTWTFGDGTVYQGNGLIAITHNFTLIGNTWVNLEIASTIGGAVDSASLNSTVCVQEPIISVTMDTYDTNIGYEAGQTVSQSFSAIVNSGSDLHVIWNYFGSGHVTDSLQNTVEFSTHGTYVLTVTVYNEVSSVIATATVNVYENIGSIAITINGDDFTNGGALPTGQSFDIVGTIMTGSDATWLLNITDNGSVTSEENTENSLTYSNPTGINTPRNLIVFVSARNPASESNVTFVVNFQDIVSGLTVTSNVTEAGTSESVLFETALTSGSSELYTWEVRFPDGTSQILYSQTNDDSIIQSFSTHGAYTLTIIVANDVSSVNETIDVMIWNEYDVIIEVSASTSPFVIVGEEIDFSANTRDFSAPQYSWNIADASWDSTQTSHSSVQHTFVTEGAYLVEVEVEQGSHRGEDSTVIYAQLEISGLELDFADNTNTYLVNYTVYLMYNVSEGTNASFTWEVHETIGLNEELVTNGVELDNTVGDNRISYVFSSAGRFRVTVIGSNGVSEERDSVNVTILEPITGLEILGCETAWESGVERTCTASIQTGTQVTYEWYQNGTFVHQGPEITHSFAGPGEYVIDLNATNALTSQSISEAVFVFDSMQQVLLSRDIEDLFYFETNGMNVTFTATVTGNNLGPLTYEWRLGIQNLTETGPTLTLLLDEAWYTLRIMVTNILGQEVRNSTTFQVQELRCEHPQQAVIGSDRRVHLKSESFKIEVRVMGCPSYATVHEWIAYNQSTGDLVNFPLGMSHDTPTLTFSERSMNYGVYSLNLTSSFQRTPASSTIQVILEIRASPLQAIIDGGTRRTLAHDVEFTIDGSPSYDPDDSSPLQNNHDMTFTWFCDSLPITADTLPSSDSVTPGDDHCSTIAAQSSSRIDIATYSLLSEHDYNITLMVSAMNRTTGLFTQIIVVRGSAVPIVTINCVSCRESNIFTISRSRHIKLIGSCTHCPMPQYRWEVMETDTGNPIHLDDNTTSTGANKSNLSIRENVLQDNNQYSFTLSVSSVSVPESTDTSGSTTSTGMASLILEPALPPLDGYCELLSINSTIRSLEDTIDVICDGWTNQNGIFSPLTYHVYVESDTDWYPIYRGTSSSITSHISRQGDESSVRLFVEVIGDSDASTIALNGETIFVLDPVPAPNQTLTGWIVVHASSELAYLQDQNDPKILMQYMIAVNLQLNAVSDVETDPGDKYFRMELRREMLSILNRIATISAIDDIQQVAYTLQLITRNHDEFPISLDMFEYTLSLMESIIDVLTDQVSPAMTGEEFVPTYLVTSVSNLVEILSAEVNEGNVIVNATVIAVQKKAIEITNSVVQLTLMTQVVEEQPFEYNTGYMQMNGRRVLGNDIETTFDNGDSQVTLNPGMLVGHQQQEVFQVAMSLEYNPYVWGYAGSAAVSSQPLIVYFSHPNASEIAVHDLEEDHRVTMHMSHDASSGRSRRSLDSDYDVTIVELPSGKPMSSKVDFASSDIPSGSSLNITISLSNTEEDNATGSTLESIVHVYLGRGYVPYEDEYDNITTLNMSDNIKFFFIENFSTGSNADKYYITLENTNSYDVNVTILMYSTTCQYYEPVSDTWSTDGCVPRDTSTLSVSVCSCNHLTMFGSSVLVSPAQLDFEDLRNLGIDRNPIAIIVVSVLTFIYIVVAIIAVKWDRVDRLRTSVVPLCGVNGPCKYEITVVTGKRKGAGSTAHVGVKLAGSHGKSGNRHLQKLGAFQRATVDTFLIATDKDLGEIRNLTIWHDNAGLEPSWYLSRVMVRNMQDNKTWYFLAKCWLTLEQEKSSIQKTLRPADEHEKSKFSTLLREETSKGFSERHLWISLFERPARNRFTRFQRATCGITVLFVYMFFNIMFYGLLHTPDDVNSESQANYVQWMDVLVGIISAIITFPVAIALITWFKHIAPSGDQIVPQNLDATEMVELECEYESRIHSGSTLSGRGQAAQRSHLLRLPSDLTSISGMSDDVRTAAVPLRRTRNTESVSATAAGQNVAGTRNGQTSSTACGQSSTSGQSRESSENSKKRNITLPKAQLWCKDSIIHNWSLDQSDSTNTSTSRGQFPAKSHDNSLTNGTRSTSTVRRERTISLDSTDDLFSEIDEIEQLYGGNGPPRRLVRFNPRADSVLDLSMGSLANMPAMEDSTNSQQQHNYASSTARMRKHSQTSRDSVLSDVQEIPLGDDEFCVPIQGLDALQPGYTDPGSDLLYPGIPPAQRLALPPKPKYQCELPHRCIYLAYLLCFVLYAISLICILLYGYEMGSDIALKWVFACFVSFLNSFFILEPLKVILVALVVAKVTKNIEGCEEKLVVAPVIESNETYKDIRMRPLAGYALLQAEEEAKRVIRMREMMRNFIAFMCFLLLVMIVNYASANRFSIYLNRHVNSTYTVETFNNDSQFRDILDYEDYWTWLENVVAPGIHARELQQEAEYDYLLGKAVLRQQRSLEVTCQARKQLHRFDADYLIDNGCYGNSGWDRDTHSYGEGWDNSNNGGNHSWGYKKKNSVPYYGHMGTYTEGGHIINLGNSYPETLEIIASLKENDWLDRASRAVLLEFTSINMNTRLFTVAAFMVEFPVSSSALPSYKIQPIELINYTTDHVTPYMIAEILLLFVLIYLFVNLVLKIMRQKCGFFSSVSNWMLLLLTSLSSASVICYVITVAICTQTYAEYKERRHGYTNFSEAAFWIQEWQNVNAVLLFVLMFVIVYQMRFIRFFARFIKTLEAAKWELLGMAFFFTAFLCYYAQLGYLWFGTATYAMHSVGAGFMSTLAIFRGLTPFVDEMMTYDHAFTACFYVSFVTIMFVYVLGTCMAILNYTYKQVRQQLYYHATVETQDYEMVDFMMKRFKQWLNITKPKPAFRKVKFEGVPSVSSRQSTAKSYRSLGPPPPGSANSSETFTSLEEEEDAGLSYMSYNRDLVNRANETWSAMLAKLDEVFQLDKTESELEAKIESQWKAQQEEKRKRAAEIIKRRELRKKRQAKLDLSAHSEISAAISRSADARLARQNISLFTEKVAAPTGVGAAKSPFKESPRKVPSPVSPFKTPSTALYDPDIIISKPPIGATGIYLRPFDPTDESISNQPSIAPPPGGGKLPFPTQPLLPPTKRRNPSNNTTSTSISDVHLNDKPPKAPFVRHSSTNDLPFNNLLTPRLYSTSTDALDPLAGDRENRRRRAASVDRAKAKPPLGFRKEAWDI